MSSNKKDYVKFFRQSSPYIHAHHGKTFVITLGGEALASPNLNNIINDISLLNSLGVRLVLVHGARPQIEERLSARGLESRFHNEKRVTDRQCLECVMDAVGNLRARIESKLSLGLVNSPMHGASIRVISGNFVTAKPLGVIDGQDFLHTGAIRRIDKEAIQQQLDSGYIVLLSCLGHSPTGELFNMEVEEVATHTAVCLEAEKLILYSKLESVRDHQGHSISRLSPQEASKAIKSLQGDSRRLLSSAITACHGGVDRAQLISYEQDGSLLLELFTRDGSGTMVSRDRYEEIRAASIEDVGGILELIRPLEQEGILRRRSRKELEREIRLFRVISLDGMIIGCAAIHLFSGEHAAELACLVVHPDYREKNRGDLLLSAIEEQASQQGMDTLFVLTTQTSHWFVERGFAESSQKSLPKEKRSQYNSERQSKILVKKL
ncbi:amino-acid N-acetyltransferase [Endozoicomonas numazuensis]|uniref:Amino-acid acetyltransferase n=1 Tax=Endozoicomonas numazuensis TaxID=1137799 RepID=A0A081NLP6_9GAMM|nr:amino-acid N-acetyltransferase [Endozoicomonas numazuensis]KEQ19369.1 N-acetylglutamate synthase [Endozoicomonas numazuensis]